MRILGAILALAGLTGVLFSALADVLGLGRYGGFGRDQRIGIVASTAALIIGLTILQAIYRRR